MIIRPSFLSHRKTRKLLSLAGNLCASNAVLQLWGYCETSRKWIFPELTDEHLEDVCEWVIWGSEKISCAKALVDCRWIEALPGGGYRVLGWDEHNAKLIANWNRNPSGKAKPPTGKDPEGSPQPPQGDPDREDREEGEDIKHTHTNARAFPTLEDVIKQAPAAKQSTEEAERYWNYWTARQWTRKEPGDVALNWENDLAAWTAKGAKSHSTGSTDHRAEKAAKEFAEPTLKSKLL